MINFEHFHKNSVASYASPLVGTPSNCSGLITPCWIRLIESNKKRKIEQILPHENLLECNTEPNQGQIFARSQNRANFSTN